SRLPPSRRLLHAGKWLLPAGAVARLHRALRMGGRCARACRVPASPGGRMRTALHAEWTKLRTVASPAWLAGATVVLTVALGALVAAAHRCTMQNCSPDGASLYDTAKLSLSGVEIGQAVVAVLAVLLVGGEYGTGMIRTTLAAIPRRGLM